jgi:hypothetical protein
MSAILEKPAAATRKAVTVGSLIDKMWLARESKKELESKAKLIEEEINSLESQLFEKLDAQGLEKATGSKASASISTSVVADVQDWDAFNAFVKKTGYFHLYQRRVSDPAFRELIDAGKKVPGVQGFARKRLNLRSL